MRNRTNGGAVAEQIRRAGRTALAVLFDASETARIPVAVAEVAAAFGTVDILVNNAFEASSSAGNVAEVKHEIVEQQSTGGFFATLAFMQACYPQMADRGAVSST